MNDQTEPTLKEEIKANMKAGQEANAGDAEAMAQGEKILAAIGYFSFLCILPLVLKPDSQFCQWHGKQGLAITILFLALSVVGWIFTFFFPIYSILGLFQFVLAGFGIYGAFQGKMTRLPLVSSMADKLDW